jgi:hypothetical protein
VRLERLRLGAKKPFKVTVRRSDLNLSDSPFLDLAIHPRQGGPDGWLYNEAHNNGGAEEIHRAGRGSLKTMNPDHVCHQ